MTWSELINKLLYEYRLSPAELAERTGLSHSAIVQIQKRKVKRPFPHTIRLLEEGLNIKINYDNPYNITFTKRDNLTLSNKIIDYRGYPIVKQLKSNPNLIFIRENIENYQVISYEKTEGCFFVRVTDQSMQPLISEGDLIFIDMNEQISDNNIVICLLKDGQELVRKFIRYNENIIGLIPINTNGYDTKFINITDVDIIYRVIKIVKNV